MTMMTNEKIYKRKYLFFWILVVVGVAIIFLFNSNSATIESNLKALSFGVIAFPMIFVFGVMYTYVALKDKKLVQRQGAFFWRIVEIENIRKISFESRYRWPLNDLLYIFVYTDGPKPVMAINPNSYEDKVLIEMLKDIKSLNSNIEFDPKSQELLAQVQN